jgi:ATP-binding cassette, subfamily C, bacterial CydC
MTRLADLGAVLRLFLRERPGLILAGAGLAAVTVLAGIGLIGLSGWFITATAIAGASAASAIAFDVFAPSAGIRLLALGRTAARYGERLVTHDATLRILAALRERLFRGWAGPQAAHALLMRPARLLFRLTADIDALDSLYLRVLVPFGAAAVTALAAGLAFGLMDWRFGLLMALLLIVPGLGLPMLAARRAAGWSRRRAHAVEALRSRAIDLVAGQTELVMTGRLAAQARQVMAADRRAAEAEDRLNRIEAGITAGFGAATALILSAALVGVAALAQRGAISAPVAALGVLIALGALEPFSFLRRGALELGRTLIAARRVAPRLGIEAAAPRLAVPGEDAAIRLTDVTVGHPGATRPALHHLDVAIARGERVALIGPSGTGKSTLLGLIAGELAAGTGTVAALPSTVLTQRTELFQDSVRDNLRLVDPAADDARLWAALEAAGLAADMRATGRGLDTVLGEGGLGLSGGQARRLALARLFLRDTPLWLADEPTEALDRDTAADVLRRLADHAAGRTLVVATHLRREASLADRLLILDSGRIVAEPRRGEPGFDAALAALRPD